MDETAYETKHGSSVWLHEALASVAAEVVVSTARKRSLARVTTGPRSVIYRGDVCNVAELLDARSISPEVIVAGELIEHLPNRSPFCNPCAPKARCVTDFSADDTECDRAAQLSDRAHRPRIHPPDHLTILSYKTLSTLFRRAGFSDWDLIPYYSRFAEMKERASPVSRPLISGCEKLVNVAERLFPLVSFGWIGRITL